MYGQSLVSAQQTHTRAYYTSSLRCKRACAEDETQRKENPTLFWSETHVSKNGRGRGRGRGCRHPGVGVGTGVGVGVEARGLACISVTSRAWSDL